MQYCPGHRINHSSIHDSNFIIFIIFSLSQAEIPIGDEVEEANVKSVHAEYKDGSCDDDEACPSKTYTKNYPVPVSKVLPNYSIAHIVSFREL